MTGQRIQLIYPPYTSTLLISTDSELITKRSKRLCWDTFRNACKHIPLLPFLTVRFHTFRHIPSSNPSSQVTISCITETLEFAVIRCRYIKNLAHQEAPSAILPQYVRADPGPRYFTRAFHSLCIGRLLCWPRRKFHQPRHEMSPLRLLHYCLRMVY